MKLSMWMIASQLENADKELNINEHKNTQYMSVRFKYEKNCLILAQKENDVLLVGESYYSYICLKNTTLLDAFELIQGIFDKYSRWDDILRTGMETQNYRMIIDESWEIFNSPIVFIDSSNKLLAMSSQVEKDDINPEWKHLAKHGYLSVENFKVFEENVRKQAAVSSTRPVYYSNPPTTDSTNILLALVRYSNIVYGRITVLEYFRTLTEGDIHALQYMSETLGRFFFSSDKSSLEKELSVSDSNSIKKMLQGQPVRNEVLDHFLSYMGWKHNDDYRICLISFTNQASTQNQMVLILEYLNDILPSVPSFSFEDHLILLFNETRVQFREVIQRIKNSYLFGLDILFGTSLQFKNLDKVYEYVKQARYAIDVGYAKKPEAKMYAFYRHALDYIISSKDSSEKFFACQPDVFELWRSNPSIHNDLLVTFREYLGCERSLIQASNNLFMHKNTLSYRVKKILSNMEYDINDKYTREYILTSIRMLTLSDLSEALE